jgi:hypothetical protein
MIPIRSILPYRILAETMRTSRITRSTQTVKNVTDTVGLTTVESFLCNGIRAIAIAADQITTVTSGQNTTIQIR